MSSTPGKPCNHYWWGYPACSVGNTNIPWGETPLKNVAKTNKIQRDRGREERERTPVLLAMACFKLSTWRRGCSTGSILRESIIKKIREGTFNCKLKRNRGRVTPIHSSEVCFGKGWGPESRGIFEFLYSTELLFT